MMFLNYYHWGAANSNKLHTAAYFITVKVYRTLSSSRPVFLDKLAELILVISDDSNI